MPKKLEYALTNFRVPILEIWHQATKSTVAATIFLVVVMVCAAFAIVGCQQTASRLTYAFARDDALVASHWLSRIHPRWEVPVWALLANNAVVFILGFVYLGSTTAFNAIISVGVILQQVSFAFPAALLLYRRRSARFLPKGRSFDVGPLGWIANFLTIVLAVVSLIFYNFPVVMPVTTSNMSKAPSL